MSYTDNALEANEIYAQSFALADLPKVPARKLAVVACMDTRMVIEQILGLRAGDAHVIRNAGGIITEDALRSLIVSHHLLGTEEIMIINHTDCGMLNLSEDDLFNRLEDKTGVVAPTPSAFYAFDDLDMNVRRQIESVKMHPWIPATVSVRGFIYDVSTGRLREVGY